VDGTTFSGTALFTGTDAYTFQVCAGTRDNDQIDITRSGLSAETSMTTVTDGANFIRTDRYTSQTAIDAIDAALDTVNSERANYGAAQNRFESVISNLQISAENVTAARSRIMDADFAKETAELTRTQILTQAGTAMLAQANQAPQNRLSLLR